MNFVKLNKQFHITGIVDQKKFRSYGLVREGKFRGIRYSTVLLDNKQRLLEVVPEQYRDEFVPAVMRINVRIPPHTDSGIKAAINFYVDTHQCVTQFWKFITDTPKTIKMSNQTDGSLFDPNDLEKVDSFTAEPTDGYLLNVSQPHSVYPNGEFTLKNNERVAVCLQSYKYSFDDMYSMLQETGSI